MWRELKDARKGYRIWKSLKRRYHIDYHTVVLLFTESDDEWNYEALSYLPDYKKRKSADREVLLITEQAKSSIKRLQRQEVFIPISEEEVRLLDQYYRFYRFFDNIVFLNLDYPQDNACGKIIRDGVVTRREMICLGLYHLREVPQHV